MGMCGVLFEEMMQYLGHVSLDGESMQGSRGFGCKPAFCAYVYNSFLRAVPARPDENARCSNIFQ